MPEILLAGGVALRLFSLGLLRLALPKERVVHLGSGGATGALGVHALAARELAHAAALAREGRRRALAAAAVLVNYLDGENCEAIASVAEGCFASRLLTACRAISEGPGTC